jgi:hypothetical protein
MARPEIGEMAGEQVRWIKIASACPAGPKQRKIRWARIFQSSDDQFETKNSETQPYEFSDKLSEE